MNKIFILIYSLIFLVTFACKSNHQNLNEITMDKSLLDESDTLSIYPQEILNIENVNL